MHLVRQQFIGIHIIDLALPGEPDAQSGSVLIFRCSGTGRICPHDIKDQTTSMS